MTSHPRSPGTGTHSARLARLARLAHRGLARTGILAGALAGALALSACGGGAPSSAPPHKLKPVTTPVITIVNFSFSPGTIVVAPGATVTVVNKDQVVHTVTSITATFDTGDIQPNQTVTFTAPAKAGHYPYECNIHQFMKGMLIVS